MSIASVRAITLGKIGLILTTLKSREFCFSILFVENLFLFRFDITSRIVNRNMTSSQTVGDIDVGTIVRTKSYVRM